MKNRNTDLLEYYTSSGTYQIDVKGEMIPNYVYYLQMIGGFQSSFSTNKG